MPASQSTRRFRFVMVLTAILFGAAALLFFLVDPSALAEAERRTPQAYVTPDSTLTLLPWRIHEAEAGKTLHGAVHNRQATAIEQAIVRFDLLDADGEQVGGAVADVDVIAAQDTQSYTVTLANPNAVRAEVASVVVR